LVKSCYCFDFKYGLPKELENEKFDYIVSSYAIHHITDAEKIDLIKKLKNKQNMDGKIIIADVAFENRQLLKECKLDAGEFWDDDEHYIIFEIFKDDLERINTEAKYTQLSPCANVLQLRINRQK